jgi:VIT1/CCC1 family predicted Fe2+/Mn2+ transporter
MEKVIDLYCKILIGTFSFIGQSFTILIGLFQPAIQRSRERLSAQTDNMSRLLLDKKSLSEMLNTNMQLIALQSRNNKSLRLLSPQRQIIRLAFYLGGVLFFVAFYHFLHSACWRFDNIQWKIGAMVLSLILFILSLLVLWQRRYKTEREKTII